MKAGPRFHSCATQSPEQASIWDRTAPLTDTQQQAIEAVAAVAASRPLPPHLRGPDVGTTPTSATLQPGGLEGPTSPVGTSDRPAELGFIGTSFEDVVLQSSTEFFSWLSELEAARANETEGKFQSHAAVLNARLAECDQLLASIDDVTQTFEMLKEGQKAVNERTSALQLTCERLVTERESLHATAEALNSRLKYFDQLETVAAEFHSTSLELGSKDVLASLQKLDECLSFVSSHPHYADAGNYTAKFRQLQGRALTAVRTSVQQSLRAAAQAAQGQAASQSVTGQGLISPPSSIAASDYGATATLMSVRFRAAIQPSLEALLQGIEKRAATSPDYSRLLRDCQAMYSEIRLSLTRPNVVLFLKSLSGESLPELLRRGCEFLLHIAQLESQLFLQLYPASLAAPSGTASALAPLIDPLSTALYDTLRPRLGGIKDIDQLCELASLLRVEVLMEDSASENAKDQADSSELLYPVVRRMLTDIQDRLVYRAQLYIKENVARFVPSANDIDYPSLVQTAAVRASMATNNGSSQVPSSPSNDAEADYTGWYPPVQRSLLLLSKLYPALPSKVFNGLAHEAVAAASTSVYEGARAILKTTGPLHAQLFTIRQLLILREQVAPFEADFSEVQRGMDFSHVRDYLRRTLTGQLPLFSLSSDNAVLQLVSRGAPRISENQVDAKKDLERNLKLNCENFILGVTKMSVEPALNFLTKVTAVRAAGGLAPDSSATGARPLREQAFAAPERMHEVVHAVNTAVKGPLIAAFDALRAYLPTEEGRGTLFRSIRSNILEAHAQLNKLMEAEYTADEVAAAGLVSQAQLEALLDGMA